MEQAVDSGVVFEVRHISGRERRVATMIGEYVMPLQDLVQHNPVDETSEAHAENQTRCQ